MRTVDFAHRAAKVHELLHNGSLCPSHHAVLLSVFQAMTELSPDGGLRELAMVLGLPDEARLALAELIAGDVLEAKPAKPSRGAAKKAKKEQIAPTEKQHELFEPALPPSRSEQADAKRELKKVAQAYPEAVEARDLELALASGDEDIMREEHAKILARAVQLESSLNNRTTVQ